MTENSKDNETIDSSDQDSPEAIDWESRILCSDGNCIGVIGSDGRCKECGKKIDGPLPEATPAEAESDPLAEEEAYEATETSDDLDWENRTLCSDGSCIGVIGPDGRCKECGKPAAD
jgi:hypothetical protein